MAASKMSAVLNPGNSAVFLSAGVRRPGLASLGGTRIALKSNFVSDVLTLRSSLDSETLLLHARKRRSRKTVLKVSSELQAIIFDCDGVILESEDLHRRAYNATFSHFSVQCPGSANLVEWKPEFYDVLQNKIGGGKPKMRWYFEEHGWPVCSILPIPPQTPEDKEFIIDAFQEWKTKAYQEMIGSGQVEPRPGVLRIMDEAKSQGIKVAVCSAATKSSVIFSLENLLGKERFENLDCFLAGDDVDKKKPDPTIYTIASKKLGVDAKDCLVVEDSTIGLQAAIGAGMNCVITYTDSTKSQAFPGAVCVVPNLGSTSLEDLRKLVSVMAC